MKAKCMRLFASDQELMHLGKRFNSRMVYQQLTVGREYTVFAITGHRASAFFGNSQSIDVLDDNGSLLTVPFVFFEIVDFTIPECWEVRLEPVGAIKLWPRQYFLDPFLHDRLSNGEESAVRIFREVMKALGEGFSDKRAPKDDRS